MNSSLLKKALPHLIAIGVFLLIAIVYCQPALTGKVVNQHDIQGWKGMAQQSFEYKEKYGHLPYWSNSMFSGMPAYQMAFETPSEISIVYLHNLFTLWLPNPIGFFFLACITFYYLLMVLRVKPVIGILGALAYAYSTYDPIIISVGHNTKMICIAYAPALIGSLLLIFQRRYITGTVLTSLFAGMIILFTHLQIAYYTLILSLAIAIAFAVFHIRLREWNHVIKSACLAILAGGIALAVNTVSLWPTNEFVKETMRGGRSELTDTSRTNKTKGGLDKDYAFYYGSYGIAESLTFLVPGLYGGGGSGREIKEGKSEFAEKLSEAGLPEDTALQYANAYAYWGDQPGHSGPVYLGAIICFLFILSLLNVKSWIKWGVVGACVFAIVLAWGKNLPGVNYFLYEHLPLYNKFRAPAMSLVIPQLGFVLLGCLAVQEVFFGNISREELWKKFRLACFITAGVFALLALLYLSFDYSGRNDAGLKQNFSAGMLQNIASGQPPTPQQQQQADEFSRSMLSGLQADRQGLFGKDLLRSIFLVSLAAGCIGLYLKNKLKPAVAIYIIVILSSFDLLAVGRRYLNNENFVEPADFESVFIPTAADNQIMADPDKHFRVFDQTAGDPFSDARASYHHNSVGGYSPAKLALYQDVIERQLGKGNINVFNMLNTKYFIVANPSTQQPEARLNTGAYGNCWFIKSLQFAKNADEEMGILTNLNTRDSAVMDIRYKNIVKEMPKFDTSASIRLIENLNDKITYTSNAASNQFAVFSEVYYPHGWRVFIDGKETTYARVNYVLRGMPVPAGKHTIEFRFEPDSVIIGDKISMWSTILLYLMLVFVAVMEFRRGKVPLTSNTTVRGEQRRSAK